MRAWTLIAALLVTAGLLQPTSSVAADAINPFEIKEWKVPYGGRSRDPDAQNANTVWFVGQSGGYLAKLDVTTSKFTRRDIDDRAGPHNVIVADDGIIWYSGNLQGYIGRYDPRADKIERIPMANSDADDPHTLVFDKDQKHIWFTVQGGNFVGRLTVASRKVDLVQVPTSS
jgi:virginiamycin B lyase